MRHRSIGRAAPGTRPGPAAWAAATALAIAAGAALWLWLRHDPSTPSTERVAAAAGSPVVSSDHDLADGFAMPAGAGASASQAQARLSPLPETLRLPVAVSDPLARVRQRHAMSRFFADARDIEHARGESALTAPATPSEAIGAMGGILSERQQSDGRAFIRYDLRTLESRVEGDPLDIFLPNLGLTAKAVVDRVESVDGLLRWSGHFVDFQEGGSFSVTHALADRYAVGVFDTPLGSFSMEARNGWGWMAPPSSDFILPAGHEDGVRAPSPTAPPEQAGR